MSNTSQTLFSWQRASRGPKGKSDVPYDTSTSNWLSRLEKRVDHESQKQATATNATSSSSSLQNEAAYFEAKQLLKEWSLKRDPIVDELLKEDRDSNLRSEVKKAWDNFEEQIASSASAVDAFDTDLDRDMYTKLLEMDTAEARRHVSNELMKKEIIKPDELDRMKKSDLPGTRSRADDRFATMRAKMEMRHAQVRQMREQREEKRIKKLDEGKSKQEVREKARQIVLAEEKARADRARREEELIQAEMSKIRSIFENERRSKTTKTTVKVSKQVEEAAETVDKAVLIQQAASESPAESNREREKERERQTQVETRRKIAELRLIRRCFAAWFNETLDSRLQFAKVSAIADFKLKQRYFIALRCVARAKRVDRELEEAKKEARQNAAADRHYTLQALRRCFFALRQFANERISEKLASQIEAERKKRVENFLQFLELQQKNAPFESVPINTRTDAAAAAADADPSVCVPEDQLEPDAKVSAKTVSKPNKPRQAAVTEPWQVTKEMLRDELKAGRANSRAEAAPQSAVAALETRQRGYQRVLNEQTRLIKEQKRLIEELRSEQRAANLQAQLAREKIEADLIDKFSQLAATANSKPKAAPVSKAGPPNSSPRNEEERPRPSKTPDGKEKWDDFSRKMEQRAAERQKLRAEREKRRKEAEEQKAVAQQLEAAERERKEQEEKARRAAETRERARIAQEQQKARVEALARAAELEKRADSHRLGSLLRNSFNRWHRYVSVSLPNRIDIYRTYHQHRVLRRVLFAWKAVSDVENLAARERANALRNRLIVARCFRAWRRSCGDSASSAQLADAHYAKSLCRTVFSAWSDYCDEEQKKEFRNARLADEHYASRQLKKAFGHWKQVPTLEKQERSREARLAEMRRKVLEVLPDFSKS